MRKTIERLHLVYGEPLAFINKRVKDDDGNVIELSNDLVKNFFFDFVGGVLNNLEFFAMYYTHNVAEENVVYESLAPTYIRFVEMMYFHISRINQTGSTDHYYTNIIELYRIWKERQNKARNLMEKALKENIKKGTTL